ncbi:MAG TPA: LON peptidase substrate-binding domain-containing protein [Chryseolinea sp.]
MSEVAHIPVFPLSILPLPGELVPLHIFEPRYRQLLHDAEVNDVSFGIYFSHETNEQKIGSLMKLESIIKRYPGGETDIIVRCEDIFSLDMLLRTYKTKMYPGGHVRFWNVEVNAFPDHELYDLFLHYLKLRNITQHFNVFNLFQVANELSLDLGDRYKFLTTPEDRREAFLLNRMKFQVHILEQEERSKDNFHLN